MRVMMMDYSRAFTKDQLTRFVDAGSDSLLVITNSATHQISETKFDFSAIVDYTAMARDAGYGHIYLMSPIGSPQWMPEDWFLKTAKGGSSKRCGMLHWKITSYWNPAAESYQKEYNTAIRNAVEPVGGTVITALGSCGESFWPMYGPWYYDDYAIAAWKDSGITDQHEWWKRDRMRILRERLSWTADQWLLMGEYCVPQYAKGVGNDDIVDDLLTLEPRPTRIMFHFFLERLRKEFMERALADGYFHKYKAWVGAEGTGGLVKHSQWCRDNDIPMEGLVCGPLFRLYEKIIDDDTYTQIKLAVAI